MTSRDKGTAVITGASSSIGARYAERLARQGYDLILISRDKVRLVELATRLQAQTDRTTNIIVTDLTAREDLEFVERHLRRNESITMLVNNAAAAPNGSLPGAAPGNLEAMILLDVTALTRLSLAVVPGLVERGRGVIVNVGPVARVVPEGLYSAYIGTRAYVVNFTRTLHAELGPKGVQVQAVLPIATRSARGGPAGQPGCDAALDSVRESGEMVDVTVWR